MATLFCMSCTQYTDGFRPFTMKLPCRRRRGKSPSFECSMRDDGDDQFTRCQQTDQTDSWHGQGNRSKTKKGGWPASNEASTANRVPTRLVLAAGYPTSEVGAARLVWFSTPCVRSCPRTLRPLRSNDDSPGLGFENTVKRAVLSSEQTTGKKDTGYFSLDCGELSRGRKKLR